MAVVGVREGMVVGMMRMSMIVIVRMAVIMGVSGVIVMMMFTSPVAECGKQSRLKHRQSYVKHDQAGQKAKKRHDRFRQNVIRRKQHKKAECKYA